MSRLTAFIKSVPPAWQAVAGICLIFGTAFTMGSAMNGFTKIPATVERNTLRIDTLEVRVRQWQPAMDKLPKTLQQLETLERNVGLSNCLTIAERSGRDWRECLNE